MNSINKKLLQIKDSIGSNAPKISFEFFPPRSEVSIEKLKSEIKVLEALSPHFVSVTYGAGGTTSELTYDIVKHIKQNTSLHPAAHLTCVNSTKEQTNNTARSYLDIGVNRIVALRGDVPGFTGDYIPHPGGYAYADELVAGLKELGNFDISVAAYPEIHPQAPSSDFDIAHLKRKMDAGADRAVTQYCFDTDVVLKFIEKARKNGVNGPITAGIVTMNSFEQLKSFSKRCGSSIPQWMIDIFDGSDGHPQSRDMAAVAVAAEQCRLLMEEGIDQFHFYTLNRADLTIAVCRLLGIKVF